MSAAAAAQAPAADAPPKKGKKKLIIILAAVLLLAGIGGGAAVYMMKKKAAEEAAAAEEEDGEVASHAPKKAKKDEHSAPPVFVPLDMFTVNLADREAERYAQVGVTLEIDEAPTGDKIKSYMPAIRNNILMVLAHKTAGELLERDGKIKLAKEIRREALRPMGVEVEDEDADEEAAHDDTPSKKKKKKKRRAPEDYPIRAVHFSNFIIQ